MIYVFRNPFCWRIINRLAGTEEATRPLKRPCRGDPGGRWERTELERHQRTWRGVAESDCVRAHFFLAPAGSLTPPGCPNNSVQVCPEFAQTLQIKDSVPQDRSTPDTSTVWGLQATCTLAWLMTTLGESTMSLLL